MKKYFGEIYKPAEGSSNRDCINLVPTLVTQDMNDHLLAVVTDSEVKEAVFNLGALKAPGPDGLNGMFYQSHWETIKTEICEVVRKFFTEGSLPKNVNETVMALIPKIPLPEDITQLRPISCCNFLYKIISKVVVTRLKKYMGELVLPQQSAFVGGRMIQDNLVIAQEVFHSLRRRERGGRKHVAVKLDINKAYDRLDWDFLRETLTAVGFHRTWVNLVMTLVSTVTYQYKINGFILDPLSPSRGLRQGDPLSPYLFILAAEVLSYMIKNAL